MHQHFMTYDMLGYVVLAGAGLFLIAAKAYVKIFGILSCVISENHNVEKILLDIRDGTRKFYEEKRTFPRIAPAGAIIAEIVHDGLAEERAVTINISTAGALVRARREARQGDIIDVRLFLPLFIEPLRIKAKVARVTPSSTEAGSVTGYDIGLNFTGILYEDKERLQETMRVLGGRRSFLGPV